jgi:hypothetical protein
LEEKVRGKIPEWVVELTSGVTVDKEKGVGNAAVTRLRAENNVAVEHIPKRTGTR